MGLSKWDRHMMDWGKVLEQIAGLVERNNDLEAAARGKSGGMGRSAEFTIPGVVLTDEQYARLLKLVNHYLGWGPTEFGRYLRTGNVGFVAGNGGSFPNETQEPPDVRTSGPA